MILTLTGQRVPHSATEWPNQPTITKENIMSTTTHSRSELALAELVLQTGIDHSQKQGWVVGLIELDHNDGVDCAYDFCTLDGDLLFAVSFTTLNLVGDDAIAGILDVRHPIDPDEREFTIVSYDRVKVIL